MGLWPNEENRALWAQARYNRRWQKQDQKRKHALERRAGKEIKARPVSFRSTLWSLVTGNVKSIEDQRRKNHDKAERKRERFVSDIRNGQRGQSRLQELERQKQDQQRRLQELERKHQQAQQQQERRRRQEAEQRRQRQRASAGGRGAQQDREKGQGRSRGRGDGRSR